MTLYALDGVAPQVPVDGDFWVAPGASVMGRVHLSAGCSVWFGAVLRGDAEEMSFGEGTNVQDNAVCHVDPGVPLRVGAHVTVGHAAILHGCEIGEGSLIGMGATVLNGARIGSGCLIGAGALVTEGKEIPDGWLAVGSPAKPVRELAPAEREGLLESSRRYRANMARFKAGLAPG
ncbi:MAG: gamma carbonic anhydrase family protein [Pseudomonadota bacterium]